MDKQALHPKMYMYRRIVEAKLFIDKNYQQKIDLDNIANQAHFSKFHFLRLFKNAFGKSPHQYLTEVRVEQAKKLLKDGVTVKEVCYDIGFDSIPSFISLFKKLEGITPYEYLKQLKKQAKISASNPFHFVPNCFVESYRWNE